MVFMKKNAISSSRLLYKLLFANNTGLENNFFNNLPVGQVIANVCLPGKISTCLKQIGTVNFDVV